MEKQRADLKFMFRDGARPNGNDFSDLLESFIHRADDGFTLSAINGAQVSNFTLGNFNATPVAGSMKYAGGTIQFWNGSNWKNVSSNDLGFQSLTLPAPSSRAADAGYYGRVGINIDAPPAGGLLTYDLEVGGISTNSKTRVGTAVTGGAGGTNGNRAVFSHSSMYKSTINGGDILKNFAVSQNSVGALSLNAVSAENINFCVDGVPKAIFVSPGQLILGGTAIIDALVPSGSLPSPNAHAGAIPLHVRGYAIKDSGGANWLTTSDARTKTDINEFTDGLEQVRALNPVRFRYNGKGGTKEGSEQVGLIGQEVEKILPYMVIRLGNKAKDEGGDNCPEDMILLDSGPLIYVLLNAVQELDKKITSLETNQTNII